MLANKILNNNFISSTDEAGHEIVIMGKGLGWKMKAGDPVDETKIEKIFRMDTVTSSEKMKKLFIEVDISSVEISSKIIHFALETLDTELNKNVILTLTDHIDFAVERFNKGIALKNDFKLWIKKMFPKEYEVGLYSLTVIEEHLGIKMPEDEAAHISMHLINAHLDGNMSHTDEITTLLSTCFHIIEIKTGKRIIESSLAYERFMRHLLALAQRIIARKENTTNNHSLNEAIKMQFPNEHAISLAIRNYIQKTFEFNIVDDEVTFLTIHINRLLIDVKPDKIGL